MTLVTSDFLNPMLVRDLRQGLRSSRFTLVFLLLQVCMAFFVTMGLLSGQGSEVGHMLTRSLMVAFILFYLLGLPMAATFAFWSEFAENRIDLLKLTQLSARGLVWGKWISLFVQGLLVFFSMLPYLILTYFFGDVDLGKELLGLTVLLALCAMLTAAGVVISCFCSGVFQVLAILGLLGVTYQAFNTFSLFQENSYAMDRPNGGAIGPLNFIWQNPGLAGSLFITAGLPALWLLLEYGAARLAPISENHDTPQRLVLLGLIAFSGLTMVMDIAYAGTFMDDFTDLYLRFASWLGLLVLMFAAGSEPSPYPGTYRPFVRFGFLGKLVGRTFLYPGWPSATPFVLLVTAFYSMLATAWYSLRQQPLPDGWLIPFLLLPPAVLFPQLAGWIVFGRSRLSPAGRYFTIWAISLVLYFACLVLYNATQRSNGYIIAASILPPDAWLLFATNQMSEDWNSAALLRIVKIIAASVGGLTIAIMCLRSLWHTKKTRQLEKRAADALRQRRARPAAPVAPAPPAGI
ncbi:MAG TPA: hypothetical protein VHC95_03675 [Opitutales bacterium]|nr:hypothetical protein [Opitutales bacterium]